MDFSSSPYPLDSYEFHKNTEGKLFGVIEKVTFNDDHMITTTHCCGNLDAANEYIQMRRDFFNSITKRC